jgi:hypothetical protein
MGSLLITDNIALYGYPYIRILDDLHVRGKSFFEGTGQPTEVLVPSFVAHSPLVLERASVWTYWVPPPSARCAATLVRPGEYDHRVCLGNLRIGRRRTEPGKLSNTIDMVVV